MISKQIHYTFGFDENFCNKPLSRFHFWNILSAKKHNPTYEIVIHYIHEPTENEWWDQIKTICGLDKIQNIESFIGNLPYAYSEHKVDLFRIKQLYNNGGIYLDIDVVCLKSFDSFLEYPCVMGIEHGNNEIIGLCNAVIFSEQKSEFLKIWIEEFERDYRPQWEYNCVRMPYSLSQKHPTCVHIEPVESFFKFSWDKQGQKQLFYEKHPTNDCYCIHLWEHKNFDILKNLNNWNKNAETTISQIYQNIRLL